jgi:protein SCO1/2
VTARLALALLALALLPGWAGAHTEAGPTAEVGFDQRLGEQVPPHLAFRDEAGRPITLAQAAGGKPMVLTLLYYRCTMLCPIILDAVMRPLPALPFKPGKDFTLVTLSIDPRETPELASKKKAETLARSEPRVPPEGWRFLTGDESAIAGLTQAVGFRYRYDAAQDEYAHAAGVVLLTAKGRVSRYLYGVEFAPRDLRLGLVEAAEGRIGSAVDQVLLLCYHYDPVTGRYSLVITTVMRVLGSATVLAVGALLFVMLRRERRLRPAAAGD